MVEFIKNIWGWLVLHTDEIVLFFTSGNVAAFITAITMFVKQFKFNKQTNEVSNNLTESLKNVSSLANDVSTINETNSVLSTDIVVIKEEVDTLKTDTEHTLALLTDKINAMLDVQSLVYSTIRDESIRTNVQNIINDAKYSETFTKEALEMEINVLKENLTEKINSMKIAVEDTVKTTKNTKTKKKADENSISRY